MNGASKILTVSYGTFSCTLEGFDDPFNTMKAIAEYFRDLAAEDRYFGAEPPTPDAAMLHRIAEREIQRRVEAKIQENGVVLRASGTEMGDGVPAAAPPAAAAPVVAAAPVAAPAVAEAPAPVAASPAPSVAAADAVATESVVARLSRLRSEVAAQPGAVAPVATMPTVSFAIPDYLEDEHAEVIESAPLPDDLTADLLPEDAEPAVEAVAIGATEDAPLPEAVEPVEADADEAVLAALAAGSEADPVADEEAGEEAVAAAPTPEVEADLPESLMAALADSTSGAVDEDVAEVVAPDLADDDAFADLSGLIAETDLAGDRDVPVEADVVAEVVGAEVVAGVVEAEVAAADAGEEDAVEAEAVETDAIALPEAFADQDDVAEPAATLTRAEAPLATAEEAEEAEEAQDEAVEAAFAPTVDETAGGPELRPGAAEKLQRARARVIRIRRGEEPAPQPEAEAEATGTGAEAEASAPVVPVRPRRVSASAPQPASQGPADITDAPDAEAEDDFEANLSSIFAEVVEEEDDIRSPAKPVMPSAAAVAAMDEAEEAPESLLSADDEAELMRELAALRTNEEDTSDGAAAGASAFVLQQDARKGFSGPTADEALGRLMKQTDSEMEGPENKRRQSAIAHLKAAVAATVAERKVAGDKPADVAGVSRLARYRNDLAMAVKSALPGRGGSEPAKDRPAPLVLVSEQRIDKPRPAPHAAPVAAPAAVQPIQPVRPRRVSASGSGLAMQAAESFDDNDTDEDAGVYLGDTRGFGDFVDRVGAVTLEEILEASAAYLAGVEGLESFSRPQVMNHLGAVVPPGTFQREDGLRGFGTLLRNGRITKLRRGQFVLAEDSAYLAEARKIAG